MVSLSETHLNYLSTLRGALQKSTPLIRQAFNDLTLLVKFGERVKSFELALKYYGLLDDEKFFDGLKESPPVYAQIIDDEHVWENSIIEKIIGRLKKQNITISKDIILLLYREHNGFNTTNVFRRILDSDKNLNDIAKILIDSKKLVKPPSGIIYKPQEIVSIIKKVGNFDIREINELLSKSLRLLDYLNSYIEFLHKNRVDPNFKPNIEFIVNELNDENITFEQQVVELAYKVGKIVFGKISSLDDNLVEGFARASISIKFHDERSLRDFACRYSGEDHATAIIKAYYEKAKEIDRKETVSIEELLNNSKLIKDILDDKGKDPGFGFLESQLKEGTWYDSTAAYLKDFFEKKTVEIKEQISNIENFAILKEAMKMTFQKVKIGTVEKAIDAQVFGAYVIMSSSEEGHLMDLVDLLSKRDLSALKEEKRWHLKPPKQIENNKKIYKVTPKYDFMKFSRSTRIGVLQKGESFLEFQNSFLQDLKTILYQKNENFNIGLVIQRITPSKYSFGILDDQDLSDNVDIKNLDVARYIARLASENVPFEEQASIMKFEKDLDLFEIVNMKSMYELIRGKNDDIDYKEKNILESQELKEIIIKELEEKVGSKNFKSLALDLRHSNIRKNEISPIIRDILEKRFLSVLGTRKAKVRANLLSSRFLDALEVLALSYELQQQ